MSVEIGRLCGFIFHQEKENGFGSLWFEADTWGYQTRHHERPRKYLPEGGRTKNVQFAVIGAVGTDGFAYFAQFITVISRDTLYIKRREKVKSITFTYEKTCLIDNDIVRKLGAQLVPEIERVKQTIAQGGYESVYASVNTPTDTKTHALIKKVVEEKKALRPTVLVVVGIGGSSLGTIAVHQALYGAFYNQQHPDIKLYIADTVDTDYLQDIVLLVTQELEGGNAVILNIVSKSGSTTETLINAQLFIHLIAKAYPDTYQQYIVITTDEGSKVWNYAGSHHITLLPVPSLVGGRYSVFSAVGLFPLALLGVDIDLLCQGAREMRDLCVNSDIINNTAAVRAVLLAEQYRKGIAIHDMFIFSVDVAGVGAWYRQLMGESIGKEVVVDGEKKYVGITPTVSMGTVDLHSVGQLYLGGPYSRFTTFVAVAKNASHLIVPEDRDFALLMPALSGKSVTSIMEAILQGVQLAYVANKRPFVGLTIPEKNPYYIGMLMQLHMLEMIYLGFLLEVNPFDQPHVELYKQETRTLLNAL